MRPKRDEPRSAPGRELIAALRAVNARRRVGEAAEPAAAEAAVTEDARIARQIEAARRRLAVYGTLAPGGPNHHLLEPLGGAWMRGVVRGTLCPRGWGAKLGFPALTWDPGGDPVEVDLLESEALEAAWPELDAFEGDGYLRILLAVEVTSKFAEDRESVAPAIVAANLYALHPDRLG